MKEKLHWGLISTYRQEIMGAACLWVIFHHNFFDWPAALEPLRKLAAYGNCGVDIFLFLSGISLYFAYCRRPKLGHFYFRRFSRLLIPYIFLSVPYWAWRDLYLQKANFLLDFSMLSFPMDGTITTWYVGAILVFYLIYPLIFKVLFELDRIPLGKTNTVAILLPAAAAAFCLVLKAVTPEFYENIEIGLTRLVIFLIGCKAGQWVYEKKPLRLEYLWICGVFLLFLLLFRETVPLSEYWIRMSYVPTAIAIVLLAVAALNQFSWKPLNHVLNYFGGRSLEIYLSHVMLKNVFLHYFEPTILDPYGILSYAIIVAISLLLSETVHRLSRLLLNVHSKIKQSSR